MNGVAVLEANRSEWAGAPLYCGADLDVTTFEHWFRFVSHALLLNAVAILGILGNAVSIAVLSRGQARAPRSITLLLIWLACADTVLLITSILLFGLTAIYPVTGLLFYYYYIVLPMMAPYLFPIGLAAQTASVYLTLAVTIERYVAVCHPLRAASLCTPGRAKIAFVLIIIGSLLYNLPKYFEVEYEHPSDTQTDVYCIGANENFRSDLYVTIYIHWVYLFVMYVIPFFSLAFLNARIYSRVRRANAERRNLTASQRREIGLATMLLIVVLAFFFCNILPLVTNGLEVFSYSDYNHSDSIVKASNFFVTLNCSVNFVIYVTFGDKFKRDFVRMFFGRWRALRSGTSRWGRESPDDSYASTGERLSLRAVGSMRRVGSQFRNGSTRVSRAQQPPAVYYPPQPTGFTDISAQC